MKSTSRRKFILNTSLVTGGVLIAGRIAASKKNQQAASLSCAPDSTYQLSATISSVKTGKWSDSATWGGRVPSAADTLVIASSHTVTFDLATATVAGVNINSGGTLTFDSTKSTTLVTTRNVLVQGKLQMRPGGASIIQTLRFSGINENNFAGGGMDPLDSDVGLWVMGGGQLDLVGASKTSWTRAVDSINNGATSVEIQSTSGWAVGDEITIAPTDSPTGANVFIFDDRTITAVSGSSITVNSAISRAHAKVNNLWTAEVLNLTRNVRIEGTSSGKSHVFIRSSSLQTIKYVQFRYMGPRKNQGGDSATELVLGRYGLHFHHSMDGSRGSVVEGCVIRDTDNHAYVPHVSNGILFKSNISYNTTETAFWWDEGSNSHEIVYDGNIVAKCKYVFHSLAVDTGDPTIPNFSVAGFLLGMGDDNVANNNVVVGSDTGDIGSGAAYFWQANNEGVWVFMNNVAHNNKNGILTWQNSTKNHVIEGTIIYNNGLAVNHGAYANNYTYRGGAMYGNAFTIEASSGDTNRVRLENIAFDGAGIITHCVTVRSSPIPAPIPIFIRGCSFKGFTKAGILDVASNELKCIDVIQCTAVGTLAQVDPTATSQEVIRVQPASGQPVRVTKSGSSSIAAFAPSVWGNGSGLKAEYFNSNNFSNKICERLDSVIAFSEWSTGVHNKITSTNYSIRWTGQVQAQFSEDYTFQLQSGGGHRLWINNKLVLDFWSEHYPDVYKTAPIKLVAGSKYDIKLEYFNTDSKSFMGFFWSSPSLPVEYVPQSQLFATITGGAVPPANQGPIANAGGDITISAPTSSVTLNGTASSDPDGSIAAYKWIQVSGSASSIQNSTAASTTVSGLAAGTYIFRLQVTDNAGATATDDVTVTVNAAQAPPATLTVAASPNPSSSTFRITLTSTSSALISLTILDSSGNVKEAFANLPNNTSGYIGQNYARGTYYAVAQQGTVKTTIQLSKL